VGISLSPRAINRLQTAAAMNKLSQGEYIERLFDGDDSLLRPSMYPQWKWIQVQPNKQGDLESVGRAFAGVELAQLVGAGWRVESITPTGQNDAFDVVISIDADPEQRRDRNRDDLHKDLRHTTSRRGFSCTHEQAMSLLGPSYMQKGSIAMMARRDGRPDVAYHNEEWRCGCIGERYQPGEILFMKPCSEEHQRLFESMGFTASRPFGS